MKQKLLLIRSLEIASVLMLVHTHSLVSFAIILPLVLWVHWQSRVGSASFIARPWADNSFVTSYEHNLTKNRPELTAERKSYEKADRSFRLSMAILGLGMTLVSFCVIMGWGAKKNNALGISALLFFAAGTTLIVFNPNHFKPHARRWFMLVLFLWTLVSAILLCLNLSKDLTFA